MAYECKVMEYVNYIRIFENITVYRDYTDIVIYDMALKQLLIRPINTMIMVS